MSWLSKKLTKDYTKVPLLWINFNFKKFKNNGKKNSCECNMHPYLYQDEELRNKWCVKNCECLVDYPGKKSGYNCREGCRSYEVWIENMKEVCHSLGDCGNTLNAFGIEGYFAQGSLEDDTDVFIVTEFWRKVKEFEEEYG